ncbi:putative disease resistance protein RGA3 [Trifolium repens]|nr:putative disease resistance protein RGA3 [Trifolium repens]
MLDCFVVICSSRSLIKFPIPLGNVCSSVHASKFKVCKFWSLHTESGSLSSCLFSRRSRHLKCFNLPMELGKLLYLELVNCKSRKYLHLDRHVFKKCILFAP